MTNPFAGEIAHSAEYFGETRDYWWNADFLGLMARRWRLEDAHGVLDVGCGVGHWGMLLDPVLPADARIVGVDRDPIWIARATERALARSERFTYCTGVVERLPFADDTFDLTTCQTLLIHVPDVRAALAEMIRVTKPGGLVAVVEPNNLASSLLLDSVSTGASVDDVLALVRLQLVCERGKATLGEGNTSVGDLLPGQLAALGLEEVTTHMNDKANQVVPPYATTEERAMMDDLRTNAARPFWIWSMEDTRRYFLAGGGDASVFAAHWDRAKAAQAATVDAIAAARYSAAGGAVSYCVAGRKPATRR